jgi:hypothetical protein
MLKDRIAELKAIRDQAPADAERALGAIERQGPVIKSKSIKAFARTACKRTRIEGGGYRRDCLRALAQRVEVNAQELPIMGSKSELLRTIVATSSAKRRVSACPALDRSGAPDTIRTCDLCLGAAKILLRQLRNGVRPIDKNRAADPPILRAPPALMVGFSTVSR